MRKTILTLSFLLSTLAFVDSCKRMTKASDSVPKDAQISGSPSETTEPASEEIIVDNVKTRKDPKGGWFGPSLRDVYPHGEDTPEQFCDSGPSIPTGKLVTVFYRDMESQPESSACKEVVAVVDGKGVWKDGKAITMADLAGIREHEQHFEHNLLIPIVNQMDFAWRNPQPIGKPCDGSLLPVQDPSLVEVHTRNQNCSIVIVYQTGLYAGNAAFANWKTVGVKNSGVDKYGPAPTTSAVIEMIRNQFGSTYVIMH